MLQNVTFDRRIGDTVPQGEAPSSLPVTHPNPLVHGAPDELQYTCSFVSNDVALEHRSIWIVFPVPTTVYHTAGVPAYVVTQVGGAGDSAVAPISVPIVIDGTATASALAHRSLAGCASAPAAVHSAAAAPNMDRQFM